MRGQVDPQSGLFSYFSVEERIPADHPLRRVKVQADAVLGSMSAQFDAMYATVGSTFSKNRERLIEHDIVKHFFAGVVEQAKAQQLLSDEHFTVDGTLVESWASFKSLKRKDGEPPRSGSDGTGLAAYMVGAAYNLLRMARLQPNTG